MDTFWRVAEGTGIFITILMFFGIDARKSAHFLRQNRPTVDLGLAFVVVVLDLVALIPLLQLMTVLDLRLWVLLAIMLSATLGAWLPVFLSATHSKRSRARLRVTINIIGFVLAGFSLAGFWVVTWPEWTTAFWLTCAALLMIVLALVRSILAKGKPRQPQSA